MATDFEYKCTLKPETLEKAKRELNEDPETRMLELKAFRDRLLQYPGLRPRTDPDFLIRFLRARKFDQERAFELYLNYYRLRKDNPDIFTGLKPSNVKHVYKSAISFPHKLRDREGRRVYITFPARVDTSHYTYTEVFKAEFLNMSRMIQEEEDQVNGYTLLIDYRDFHLAQFLHMNMEFGKRIGKMWTDTFPARQKNCLLVFEPPFIDLVMALFTPFVKAKLVSRVRRIGNDMKKLHEYIDPACLPAEYGGTLPGTMDGQEWEEEMMKCDQQMEEESKFGFVDYTLSNSDHKKEDAISNMAGTFKKLDV